MMIEICLVAIKVPVKLLVLSYELIKIGLAAIKWCVIRQIDLVCWKIWLGLCDIRDFPALDALVMDLMAALSGALQACLCSPNRLLSGRPLIAGSRESKIPSRS